MKLRDFLNRLQAQIGENFTEDDLLDLEIKVTVPTSLNMKTTNIGVEQAYVHTEKVEIKERFVAIDTNIAT